MQGFTLVAVKGAEKHTLAFYLTKNSDSQWSLNVSQGYLVMVRACRVCQGQ